MLKDTLPAQAGRQTRGSAGVDAVDRALSLLRCFTNGDPVLTLTQLSEATGLYKSTVLRLAVSLERAGFLVRRADKAFALGAELLRLGGLYTRSFRLEDHVRPVLRDLQRATGESASFFTREGGFRVCLFREDSLHSIRDHIREGDRLSLDKGAAGHVLRGFDVMPGQAPGMRDALDALPRVSFGERDAETAAVAAPVFGAGVRLAGAIGVSGPLTRFDPDALRHMGPLVVAAARALSDQLGGGPAWAMGGPQRPA